MLGERLSKEAFNELIRNRTKEVAVRVVRMYVKMPKTDEFRVIGKQLLRSATSMAANYSAVCRARSSREFFAKLSVVVEETDETLFWLEVLEEADMISANKLAFLKQETTELLKLFATARKNTRTKGKEKEKE